MSDLLAGPLGGGAVQVRGVGTGGATGLGGSGAFDTTGGATGREDTRGSRQGGGGWKEGRVRGRGRGGTSEEEAERELAESGLCEMGATWWVVAGADLLREAVLWC